MEHIDVAGIVRFTRYSAIGVSTFLLDLGLLFVLIDFFGVHYAVAAAVSFIIAVSINYALSRRHVFKGSDQRVSISYTIFITVAGVGLVLVVGLMYLAVDVFEFNYIVSRIIIAGFVGMWSYLLHLYLTFQVAGKK